MNPDRLLWPVGLLLLALAGSCVKETAHQVVVVRTTGIDNDVTTLLAAVTVADVPAQEVQQLLPEQSEFSLQLPDSATGEVRVEVTATNDPGCTVAKGQGSLRVSGPGRYDLLVPLSRLTAADCQTTVVLQLTGVGDKVGRLAVSASVDDKVLLADQSYAGATREITLPLGDAVRGALQVRVDAIGCRSCVLAQGSGVLQLDKYGRYALPLPLVALAAPRCPPLSGQLQMGRYAHTTTLLTSGPYAGQVVVLAGDGQPVVSTAERYDPRSGTTTAAGALLVARYGHTATLLTRGPDQGRILVTGGYNGQWLTEVEIYDPNTGMARTAASLRLPTLGHTATGLADGRVVVIGGHSDQGAYRSVDIYDPLTGVWSPADDAPKTEYQHTATLLADGRILVAGGLLQSSAKVAYAAVFDPGASPGRQWTMASSLTSARSSHTANLLPGGQIVVLGGYGVQDQNLDSAELFEPSTLTWRSVGLLHTRRGNHQAVLLSTGQLFVSGGSTTFLNQFLTDTELYTTTSGGSSVSPPLALGRSIHTATLLPDDGVLVIGGLTYSGGSNLATGSIELTFPLTCSL